MIQLSNIHCSPNYMLICCKSHLIIEKTVHFITSYYKLYSSHYQAQVALQMKILGDPFTLLKQLTKPRVNYADNPGGLKMIRMSGTKYQVRHKLS